MTLQRGAAHAHRSSSSEQEGTLRPAAAGRSAALRSFTQLQKVAKCSFGWRKRGSKGSSNAAMWAEKLGRQLGNPSRSMLGWLVSKLLRVRNKVLEENAALLCGIQPGDTVLELGHGPGLGLQSAAKMLTASTGHLIGVDYSEYMHQMAKEKMKELIASGKVTLHHCDVAAMPLEDSSVDKVFHCNCYYFWPDLRKGATEIHRVMKPGGLMVTTLRYFHLVNLASKRVMPGENWRPEAYMAALRDSGFTGVRMEDKQCKNLTFQAIFATALK
ncbi:2-phytyl-1,4-naphtoquinone methyltransferase isoform 1-T1 [Menidia menidia]